MSVRRSVFVESCPLYLPKDIELEWTHPDYFYLFDRAWIARELPPKRELEAMSSASKACRPAGRRAAALILMKVMWPPLGSASLRRSSPKQADAVATPRVPHLLPVGISNEIEIEVIRVEFDISISSVAHLTPMRPTVAHTVRSASGQPCSKTLGGNRVMRSAENRHRERSILAALIPVEKV